MVKERGTVLEDLRTQSVELILLCDWLIILRTRNVNRNNYMENVFVTVRISALQL